MGSPAFERYAEVAPPKSSDKRRSHKADGYVSAIGNNIEKAAECDAGTPEFIAGCRSAVAKKGGQPEK